VQGEGTNGMADVQHWIGGKVVAGESGRTAAVYNPATGEVSRQVALASAAEMDKAIQVAKAAQPAWGDTPPARRAAVMFRFKDLVERNMDRLAAAVTDEHGKTLADAKGSVTRGLEVCLLYTSPSPRDRTRARMPSSA